MIRHKWTVNLRNQLANLAMECDSAAAIEGAKLTPSEKECLRDKLHDIINFIDKKIR